MKSIKRAPYEYVVVFIVVVLTVVLAVSLYASRANYRKGNLLVQELSTMRSAIALYKSVNKKNPDSLDELVTSQYEVGGAKRPFLERLSMTKDGKFVDPFGNPYAYDRRSGWINSTTPGYERW